MFCLRCADQMSIRVPDGDTVARQVCPSCHYIHYENPKILVSCILFHENKVLWIKRANEPYKGRWAAPAGYMETGERAEETACRELYEETRLILSPNRLAVHAITSLPGINQVYISLIAPLPSMDFQVTPESMEIKLASEYQASKMDFAYPQGGRARVRFLYARVRSGKTMNSPAALTTFRNAAPI